MALTSGIDTFTSQDWHFRFASRLWGAVLGCTVMCAALGTVIIHGEYGHAAPPLVVAGLAIVVGWITWRQRRSGSA
jgi:hypothetical protein